MEGQAGTGAGYDQPTKDAPTTAGPAGSTSSSPLDQLAADPIFVVGHPRSGTTWVYDILTSHPEVGGILESWLFTRSVGLARLFDAKHWAPEALKQHRDATGQAVGLAQMVTRAELAEEVREFAERLLSRRLEAGQRYLVEKTPTPYTDMQVVAEVFPGVRFLHVVRDGRDMAVSLRSAALTWNPGWSAFAGDARLERLRALRRSGRSWASTVRTTRLEGGRLGERYTEVGYEELRARPLEVVSGIFSFCGIPHDTALVEQIVETNDFERQFGGGEDQFRRRGRVGDWRERFGVLDGLLFEHASGGVLLESGYESSRTWWAARGLPLRGRWPRMRRS